MEVTVVFMAIMVLVFTVGMDSSNNNLDSRYDRPGNPNQPHIQISNDNKYEPPVQAAPSSTPTPVTAAPAESVTTVPTYSPPPQTPAPTTTEVIKLPTTITYKKIDKQRAEKFILKYNKSLSADEVNRIYTTTNSACKEKNLDPALVLALIARESSFNPYAVSKSGARGLGQIMEFNFAVLGISNPYNIEENIKGTTAYLQTKLLDFQDSPEQLRLGLAAYKEGSGAVQRAGNAYSEHTADYVNDILRLYSQI